MNSNRVGSCGHKVECDIKDYKECQKILNKAGIRSGCIVHDMSTAKAHHMEHCADTKCSCGASSLPLVAILTKKKDEKERECAACRLAYPQEMERFCGACGKFRYLPWVRIVGNVRAKDPSQPVKIAIALIAVLYFAWRIEVLINLFSIH